MFETTDVKYAIKKLVNKIGEKNYRFLETILTIGLWDGVDGFRLGKVNWQDLDIGQVNNDSMERLTVFQKILYNNEPIFLGDLAVSGKELQEELGTQGREIGKKLEELLDCVHRNPQLNEKAKLLGL